MKKYPIINVRKEYYLIKCAKNEPSLTQRRYVFSATDNSLSREETIIIALCDKIIEKESPTSE